jgi:hypothetical protein
MNQAQPLSVVADERRQASLSVFISYRRDDASSAARLLYEHLAQKLGAANLFFDVEKLTPGMEWRRAINASANTAGILLVLIGPRWIAVLHDRGQRAAVELVDDVARAEIEIGLRNDDVTLVPVLVEGAWMPPAHVLPASIRPIADLQAQSLRTETYTEDVERLIEHLYRLASEHRTVAKPQSVQEPAPPLPTPISADPPSQYGTVAETIVGRDQMIVMLGSGINASCMKLASADNLAAALAHEYGYPVGSSGVDLAEVAQYVYVTRGEPDLYRALQANLTVECEVSEVHRFLATLPTRCEQLGYPKHHQLILTTNYDTLLEQAFADAREPFDLAVYVASGGDKGKFVHVPWNETPRVVRTPNSYHAFPFHDDLDLWRTLIVKIHGAVDTCDSGYCWQNNFVVTEDNYIEYLSGGSIEELVPVQILGRLRASHCLFLGYDIREWSRRVFLNRVWGAQIRARSWAVQDSPDELDLDLWDQSGRVKLIAEPLDDYIAGLSACLTRDR